MVRIGTVTLALPVHEGVSSPRVGVELVRLAVLSEFGLELAHVRWRRVSVLLPKQPQQRTMNLRSAVKGRWAFAQGTMTLPP